MNNDIKNALSAGSKRQYARYWANFKMFFKQRFHLSLKQVTYRHVQLFIAYLHNYKHMSTSSIRRYLSSIAFYTKMKFNCDPTKSFGIGLLLKSYQKHHKCKLIRKPICRYLTNKLTNNVMSSAIGKHNRLAFALIYNLMYHGALRVSEICSTNSPEHILSFTSVCLNNDESYIKLKFKSFKHSAQTLPTVMIACDSHLKHIFVKYILSRGTRAGPFICYKNRESITRTDLVNQLKQDLSDCNLNPSLYNTHSFRIGKATDMYLSGASDSEIAVLGRWKSLAFKRYIKPSIIFSG